ncbi:MAG: hypothetical protein AAFP77_19705 [Bacteroidota bacterium]
MERWLKSNPIAIDFSATKIDREKGIIYDVVMCQAGEAKTHNVHLEESFIEALVAYDQKHYSKTGNKARFGHPSLSDTTMGSQMGYFYNVRKRDNQMVGDLHLLKSADKSPKNPGIREWMLDMAEEANDFVMSSIVFKGSNLYQYNPETQQKVILKRRDPLTGALLHEFEEQKVYVEFDEEEGAYHTHTDLVESGAATESLFSEQFNQDKFAVRTVQWLRENDDILQFVRSNPAKILQMCEQLDIPLIPNEMSKKSKEGFFAHMMAYFASEEPAVETTTAEVEPTTESEVEEQALTVEPTTEEVQVEEGIQARFDKMYAQMLQLSADNQRLADQVKELREKPVAQPAQFNSEQEEGDRRSRYLCQTTLKASQR